MVFGITMDPFSLTGVIMICRTLLAPFHPDASLSIHSGFIVSVHETSQCKQQSHSCSIFSKKKPKFDAADKILAKYQNHWPSGVLSTHTLRASFEAEEMFKVATIIEKLNPEELSIIPEAMLYQMPDHVQSRA